jgi:hypothetical protein
LVRFEAYKGRNGPPKPAHWQSHCQVTRFECNIE